MTRKILLQIAAVSCVTVSAKLNAQGQSLPPSPPAQTVVFPLSEVHKGLHGVAYTVFEGVTPEPMDVEILGLLKNSLGPGQDMILGRLHGSKPEYTGVVAGMSGSPVYVDGRLLGALSYRIGQFSKDPICGITPIEEMFEVRDRPGTAVNLARTSTSTSAADLQPMETPLTFSGFSQDTIDVFGDRFRALGLTPVVGLGGAATGEEARQLEPIVPGSAVSAVLVRGDMSSAATCTVTYVDPHKLLACGHPFTQYGAVDIPMTKTNVVATLASPLNAFKIVNTTETVGSFTEDRASAIMGVFGHQARMIPVTVEVSGAGAAAARTFHYEVLDNPDLTPNAMLVSVYQSLHGTNRAGADTSYRLRGELTVKDQPPIHLASLITPSETAASAVGAALYVNEGFSRVYSNSVDKPVLTGLSLQLEAIPERRSAVLESASLSQTEASPGQTIEILATIRPYQGPTRLLHLPIKLPDTLEAGPLRLFVGDAATLDRLSEQPALTRSLGLPDTIATLNRRHLNDRLYAALLDHAPQALVQGAALPAIPLSMANLLDPNKQSHDVQLNGESVLGLASTEAGYALTGTQVLSLVVK
jgi:hypothetical protein